MRPPPALKQPPAVTDRRTPIAPLDVGHHLRGDTVALVLARHLKFVDPDVRESRGQAALRGDGCN
jgi:hypothetical protein